MMKKVCPWNGPAREQKANSMGGVVPLLVHSSPSDNEKILCHLFNLLSVKFWPPHITTSNSLGASYVCQNELHVALPIISSDTSWVQPLDYPT